MLTDIKNLTMQVMTDAKTVLAIVFAGFSDWYIEYAAGTVSALTQILSLVVLVVVIIFHIKNSRKISLEARAIDLDIELKEKKLQKHSEN